MRSTDGKLRLGSQQVEVPCICLSSRLVARGSMPPVRTAAKLLSPAERKVPVAENGSGEPMVLGAVVCARAVRATAKLDESRCKGIALRIEIELHAHWFDRLILDHHDEPEAKDLGIRLLFPQENHAIGRPSCVANLGQQLTEERVQRFGEVWRLADDAGEQLLGASMVILFRASLGSQSVALWIESSVDLKIVERPGEPGHAIEGAGCRPVDGRSSREDHFVMRTSCRLLIVLSLIGLTIISAGCRSAGSVRRVDHDREIAGLRQQVDKRDRLIENLEAELQLSQQNRDHEADAHKPATVSHATARVALSSRSSLRCFC